MLEHRSRSTDGVMTRKLTLIAVCAFEVALILFVVACTAWVDRQIQDGVVYFDGMDTEVIRAEGKIFAKHVSRGRIKKLMSLGT